MNYLFIYLNLLNMNIGLKENIRNIFKKFVKETKIIKDIFIPSDEEYVKIYKYFINNLDPEKWFAYIIGNNEFKKNIMFTNEQVTILMLYIQNALKFGGYNYDRGVNCCTDLYVFVVAKSVLLVKDLGNIDGLFLSYYGHCDTEDKIIKLWNDIYSMPTKIADAYICDCITCFEKIKTSSAFVVCNYCKTKVCIDCKISYHKNLKEKNKPLICEMCRRSNKTLNFDMQLINLLCVKQYRKIQINFTWEEYFDIEKRFGKAEYDYPNLDYPK